MGTLKIVNTTGVVNDTKFYQDDVQLTNISRIELIIDANSNYDSVTAIITFNNVELDIVAEVNNG